MRDSDLLDQAATGGPTITPEHGDAPVRTGGTFYSAIGATAGLVGFWRLGASS